MLENTVYNKVYKTELHDRSKLAIPLINEAFQEQYKGDEQIVFLESTHYIKDLNGKLVERTNDGHFQVMDERGEEYHMEAQSTPDTSMVQRVYEYDSGIAYTYRNVKADEMTVSFPRSAVLFLRHTRDTPDVMRIVIKTKYGSVVQKVFVIKLQNYTLEDLFEKRLLILIPFHIFVYENKFMVYNKDERELEKLKDVFRRIVEHLNVLMKNGELTAYDQYFLISMTVKVVENLAEKFENVVEGVKEVMIGVGIDYPGREAYYEAKAEGERTAYLTLLKEGAISLAVAAKHLNMPEEKVKTLL